MKAIEMVGYLEQYYGLKYQTFEAEIMRQYLEDIEAQTDLSEVMKKVIFNLEKKWKQLPDVAMIRKLLAPSECDAERSAVEAWNALERMSNIYRHLVVSDPVLCAALESIGGWIEFCNRTIDRQEWMRKDFLKRYTDYAMHGVTCQPRVFHGINSDDKAIMLGDKEQCKALAAQNEVRVIEYQKVKMLSLPEPAEGPEADNTEAISNMLGNLAERKKA